MRIEADNIVRIEDEYLSSFIFKACISNIEFCGLQYILAQLVNESYQEQTGESALESSIQLVEEYTIHRGSCLDVLTGDQDYIFIKGYCVSSMFITENDIVVLECVEFDEDYVVIEDSAYYASLG